MGSARWDNKYDGEGVGDGSEGGRGRRTAAQQVCPSIVSRHQAKGGLTQVYIHIIDYITHQLQVITTDIIGPFQVERFNQGRFLLTICDVATGFSEAKVMASKDQAA
ncbi:uncharacterized protein VP01_76g6 [Puccinia sorghi]|uniref:Uncharacterized protein n=1 Tax=Puccinia sorghi TaxID=27349 RepID=A0A0L6UBJ3_9BASI|nr:uncharacterized protein VP01_76g6 [Puccinia sorghi]